MLFAFVLFAIVGLDFSRPANELKILHKLGEWQFADIRECVSGFREKCGEIKESPEPGDFGSRL